MQASARNNLIQLLNACLDPRCQSACAKRILIITSMNVAGNDSARNFGILYTKMLYIAYTIMMKWKTFVAHISIISICII